MGTKTVELSDDGAVVAGEALAEAGSAEKPAEMVAIKRPAEIVLMVERDDFIYGGKLSVRTWIMYTCWQGTQTRYEKVLSILIGKLCGIAVFDY